MEEISDCKNSIATQGEEEITPWNYEVLDENLDPDPVNCNEKHAFETSYGTNHIKEEHKLNYEPIVDIKEERKLFDDSSVEAKGNICKVCPHLQQIYFSENDLKVHNKLIHANSEIKNEDEIYETLEEKPPVQLNEYETAPYFIQLSQNLTWDCLLISVYLPVFTGFCMMCS
jgi:hypothetical protein